MRGFTPAATRATIPNGPMAYRTTCIVDSHDYAGFVCAAVDSALRQTVPFTEVIVVDDASTDGSQQLLRQKYSGNPRVRLVFKEQNQGQLSAFNAGWEAATGDIVFFLDADDEYRPDYLAGALHTYERFGDCDFLICAHELTGDASGIVQLFPFDCSLGYSLVSARFQKHWVGSAASTLSVKKEVLDRFMPVPLLSDWRSRADDCIVWGASMAGAKKYFLSDALVRYRIHGRNAHFGRTFDAGYRYRRRLAVSRLFRYFDDRMPYDESIEDLAVREFKLIPYPTSSDRRVYSKIVKGSRAGPFRKLGDLAVLWLFFLRGQLARHRALRARHGEMNRTERQHVAPAGPEAGPGG